jgi:hypothetical protein
LATTYQVFEKAERIEVLSAEVYQLLAARYAADKAAKDLFVRLEEEELQHASRVRLLAARYRHESGLLGAAAGSAELDALLQEVEELVRSIRNGSFARDLDEAREKLAAFEDRASRAHAEIIARTGHPSLQKFFQALANQDRAHQDLLRAK